MAVGDGPSGPDFAAMLSLNNFSAQSGGKGIVLLAGILPAGAKDIDVTAGFTLKGKGLNADATPIKLGNARPGMISKLLADMGLTGKDVAEGVAKVGQAGAVQQMPFQQVASIADITGPGLPGGSFVSAVGGNGPSTGGGIDI